MNNIKIQDKSPHCAKRLLADVFIHENLSVLDLEGEIWIDCIGYDGIYQVSNLGRIKGVERWRQTRHGIGYMMKEQIRRQSVSEKHSSIRIGLCKDGIVKPFVTARLVFFSFNYNVPNLAEYSVIHKDNNWKNNNLNNLKIGTQNEISKLNFDNGKLEHLKLGNPILSKYRLENAVFKNEVIVKLKCSKCFKKKNIKLFRDFRNSCKSCDIKKHTALYMKKRLDAFLNTSFETTDINTGLKVIYEKKNIEDLLKIISIGTALKYSKSKEVCYPTNRSKFRFSPFKIVILET